MNTRARSYTLYVWIGATRAITCELLLLLLCMHTPRVWILASSMHKTTVVDTVCVLCICI